MKLASPRIDGGDGLRFLLQATVLLHHGAAYMAELEWLKKPSGGIAVSGFFMLSGFATYGAYSRFCGAQKKHLNKPDETPKSKRPTPLAHFDLSSNARSFAFLVACQEWTKSAIKFIAIRCLPLIVLILLCMPIFWISHPPFMAPYARQLSTPIFMGWFQRWDRQGTTFEYNPPLWFVGACLCLWATTPIVIFLMDLLAETIQWLVSLTIGSMAATNAQQKNQFYSRLAVMAIFLCADLCLWFTAPNYDSFPPFWPMYQSSWTRLAQYGIGLSLAFALEASDIYFRFKPSGTKTLVDNTKKPADCWMVSIKSLCPSFEDICTLLSLWYIKSVYNGPYVHLNALFGCDMMYLAMFALLSLPQKGKGSYLRSFLNSRWFKRIAPSSALHLIVYVLHVPMGSAGEEITAYHEAHVLIVLAIPLWIFCSIVAEQLYDPLSLRIRRIVSIPGYVQSKFVHISNLYSFSKLKLLSLEDTGTRLSSVAPEKETQNKERDSGQIRERMITSNAISKQS